MADDIIKTVAKADTPMIWGDPDSFTNTANNASFGNWGGWVNSAFRFRNVEIPAGATITSCFLRFFANGSESGNDVNVNIFFNDEDDAVAPTSHNDFDSKSRTTAFVAWDSIEAFVNEQQHDSPDLSSVLQEVIDRPGWVSGNDVMVIIEDDGSTYGAYRDTYGYYANYEAELHLEWTPPGTIIEIPVAEMTLETYGPDFGSGPYSIPVAEMTFLGRAPSYVWSIPTSQRPSLQTIYTCIVTGADDGLDDLDLPMSSFQARMRDGEPSYLAVYIPNSVDYEVAILARTNGDIVVKKGYRMQDGTINLEEIARVDYESIGIDRGWQNDTATLSGHRTLSSTAPKERELSGVSYYALQMDGKRRVRADVDLFLRPGDIALLNDDNIEVGMITYTVDPFSSIMEITEK